MKQIPCNEIWYTTTNGKVVTNFDKRAFDSNLISNTYANNQGILTFAKDLTIIGEAAFSLCEELESIILPDSITQIDGGAFSACENLQEITIPNNVTSIGECAFGLCVNLTKFSGKYASNDGLSLIIDGVLNQFALGQELQEYIVPSEVTEIGWSSFSDCQLAKIVLHNKIKKIGHSAFCGSENLSEINIPNSVTTIEDVAFQDCPALKNIFIPKSVSNLGLNIFEGCDDVSVTYEDESINPSKGKDLKQLLAEYAAHQKKSPEGYVYSGDINAKIIHIPDGVSLVKSDAFKNYDKVEVIYVPNSVKEIENGTFEGLDNLCCFEGEYASDDGRCLIMKNTLVGFAGKDIYEYTLPSGITNIAPMVFSLNKHLCTIDIPSGVRTIGYQAFWGCEKLEKIVLPDSLNVIGNSAFGGCASLAKIIIPDSVKVVGDSAFEYCTQLEEVTLPDDLLAMKGSLFTNCDNLKKINSPLMSKDGNCLIIDGVLVDYKERKKNSKCVIPNGVKTIAKSAFYGNKNIISVLIPQSVTDIGSGAFHSCSNLVSAEFESTTPPKFGYAAFYANARRFIIYVPTGTKTKYKKALKEAGNDALILDRTTDNIDDVYHEIIYGNSYDKQISTEQLVSIGVGCHHDEDYNGAIAIFEKIIAKGYKDDYPYDALIEIYKKRNDVENELRILTKAIENLPIRGNKHYEYQKRYERLTSTSKKAIYPTKAPIVNVGIKHGDIFEDLILKVPEFNFYCNGYDGGYDVIHAPSKAKIEDVWEIQRYFKKLIQDADLASTKKDYETAAKIYENIVLENYWMPTPCDKLIKLYAKSGLHDDEIRVLKYGIGYFSQLRQKRLEYVKMLAKKYNAEKFLNERLGAGGKITYYAGVFELYNPFPIIEKWKERLEKKLNQ